jgi:hypothetical protein
VNVKQALHLSLRRFVALMEKLSQLFQSLVLSNALVVNLVAFTLQLLLLPQNALQNI